MPVKPQRSRCDACNRRSRPFARGRSLTAQGWHTRPIGAYKSVLEVICPRCFARWGWPPVIPRVVHPTLPDGPRVHTCHLAREAS